MRTFAAIKIPLKDEQYALLEAVKLSMANQSIKWVDWYGLHLTLFFFGESSPAFVARLNLFLQDLASTMDSFDLSIKGLGFFGQKNKPKVLWLGTEPNEELNLIQDKISSFATKNGFCVSNQGFNPHITLARIKSVSVFDEFSQVLKSFNDKIRWQVHVDRIILYKSELNPKGARYSPVLWHLLKPHSSSN